MQKIILGVGMFCAVSCLAMKTDDTTQELYRLCQEWFQNSEIRTIASHVLEINARKGSYINSTIQVRSSSAQALFDAEQQVVTIHKLNFPGVPSEDPVAIIKFNEILGIKDLIDAKK